MEGLELQCSLSIYLPRRVSQMCQPHKEVRKSNSEISVLQNLARLRASPYPARFLLRYSASAFSISGEGALASAPLSPNTDPLYSTKTPKRGPGGDRQLHQQTHQYFQAANCSTLGVFHPKMISSGGAEERHLTHSLSHTRSLLHPVTPPANDISSLTQSLSVIIIA